MYQLTVNFSTLAELQAFLAGNAGKGAEIVKEPKASKGTEKGVVSAPAAPAAGTSSAAAPAAASAPETKPAAEPAAAPAVTYEKSGLPEKIAAAAKKDRAATVALLKEFGAAKGAELKPEQFAAFGEKVDALLKAEEALA